jgi:protocatechuate 4,5-dioxygenase alpha subunit
MQPFLPGRDITPFDLAASRRGMRLNRLGHLLREPAARARFAADPGAVLDEVGLTAEERTALAARDWNRLLAMGASIYALAKIGGALGIPLPEIVKAGRG